jgi:hypothetical protein
MGNAQKLKKARNDVNEQLTQKYGQRLLKQISKQTKKRVQTPDQIVMNYKPIGPVALTLMDRQTCVSSAHGQTDSQCVVNNATNPFKKVRWDRVDSMYDKKIQAQTD